MNWITNFLQSSIGKKFTMSITGLFLYTFLIVHMSGNLQLLKNDGGEAFNAYAEFMTHFPLINYFLRHLRIFLNSCLRRLVVGMEQP